MIPQPIRLTVDELTALAHLIGVEWSAQLGDAEEPLREAGVRSLLARHLLRPGADGTLSAPAGLAAMVRSAAEAEASIVLARNDGKDRPQAGRIVLGTGGAVVQEAVYPGLFGFTPLERDRIADFVAAAFSLDASGASRAEGVSGKPVTLVLDADGGSSGFRFPDDWEHPVVNVLVAEVQGRPQRDLSWVSTDDGAWLLGARQEDDGAVEASAITEQDLTTAVRALATEAAAPPGASGTDESG